MGFSSWDASTTRSYVAMAASTANLSREQLFAKGAEEGVPFAAQKITTVRESRDSEANPLSTPIIVASDHTGSMGFTAEAIVRTQMGKFVPAVHELRPVSDPHVMNITFGDIRSDRYPLQVSQFEPDLRIVEQLRTMYLEGNGGGNGYENPDLVWAFAARNTRTDAYEKRGIKGFLFTLSDEPYPQKATSRDQFKALNIHFEREMTTDEVLAEACEKYNVFHIIVEQGHYCSSLPRRDDVIAQYRERLGRRAIRLDNVDYLSEVMIACMLLESGKDVEAVLALAPDEARATIRHALFD